MLLTYIQKDGYFNCKLFQDIEEINDFIKSPEGEKVLEIIECVDSNSKNIDLKELCKK